MRGTRLGPGAFDDGINPAERFQGLNASLQVRLDPARGLLLEPFWLRSEHPAFSASGSAGAQAGFNQLYASSNYLSEGPMRPYAGTDNVPGHELGGLLRLSGAWSVTGSWDLGAAYEHFATGEVLQRAGVPSGSYGYVRSTFRY